MAKQDDKQFSAAKKVWLSFTPSIRQILMTQEYVKWQAKHEKMLWKTIKVKYDKLPKKQRGDLLKYYQSIITIPTNDLLMRMFRWIDNEGWEEVERRLTDRYTIGKKDDYKLRFRK